MKNQEPLIKLHPKTDFEKNLFLKSYVKKLEKDISVLRSDKTLREKDIEIGKLKSYIDEIESDKRKLLFKIKNNYSKISESTSPNKKNRNKVSVKEYLSVEDKIENYKIQLAGKEKNIKNLKEELAFYREERPEYDVKPYEKSIELIEKYGDKALDVAKELFELEKKYNPDLNVENKNKGYYEVVIMQMNKQNEK